MRFLPLVLLVLFVPLAFVRSFGSDAATSGVAERREAATLAEVLPGEAVWVVRTCPLDELRARAAGSDWVRFFGDERFGGALGRLVTGLEPRLGGDDGLAGILADVRGEAALFLAPTASGGLGGGVLLRPGEGGEALGERLQAFVAQLASGAEQTRGKHAGVECLRIERPGRREVLVAFAMERLVGAVFAPDVAAADRLAQATIDRQRGEAAGPGFEGSALGRTRPEAAREPALSLHVALQAMVEATGVRWDKGEDDRFARLSGLDSTEWLHALVDFDEGETLDATLALHLPDGVLAALADGLRPLPADMAELAPAESLGVGLAGYDVAGAFDALQDFLETNDPQSYQGLRMGLQLGSAQLGFDLERDVFGQLTGRFASFSVRVPQEEVSPLLAQGPHAESLALGGAFFAELRDPEALGRVFERITSLPEVAPYTSEETWQDWTVHTLSVEDAFRLRWAFSEHGLYLAEHEAALHAALERSHGGVPGSAAGEDRFREGLASAKGASVVSLVETESTVASTLATLHALLALASGQGGLPFPLPFELPDPSMAGEYFDGVLSFTVERAGDVLRMRLRGR